VLIDSYENKEKILKNFLKISEIEGWSEKAMIQAFEESEINPSYQKIIFENEIIDLAEFFISYNNQKTYDEILKIENFHQKKIREKIQIFLYNRFIIEKNNKIAIRRLINFYLNPKNFCNINVGVRPVATAMKSSYLIADFIWLSIKDRSTDYNFYTKRLILSKIIIRVLLKFLNDNSNELDETRLLIDKEIEKVMKFEKMKSKFKSFVDSKFSEFDLEFCDKDISFESIKKSLKKLPFIRLINK